MTWWIEQAARLNEERVAVSELQDKESWIRNVNWRLVSGPNFAVDFEIQHADETFALTMRYPEYFPSTPPLVCPQDKQRLSIHQWGGNGELCLEFRPDNWEPGVTGAMMIESAYRLLSGERSIEDKGYVPSAHNLSKGQELRGENLRFIMPQIVHDHLKQISPLIAFSGTFSETFIDKTYVASLSSILSDNSADAWEERIKPYERSLKLFVFKTIGLTKPTSALSIEEVASLFDAQGFAAEANTMMNGDDLSAVLLLDEKSVQFGYLIRTEERRKVLWYETIAVPQDETRLPKSYVDLPYKSVGIIGCGSLGSKIAASLARAGVGAFVLVDDDILMPGNIIRNDLDRSHIGHHKATAVRDRILEINPSCKIKARLIALGGQEAAGTAASTIEQLAACDLIIDATANPYAFNMCAAVTKLTRKPLIWGEVFAGGIGGLIVRSRPDKDPPPLAARRQVLAWCEAQGVPWVAIANAYDLERADQVPLIADDGDVSVIAAHVVRFVLDCLLKPEETIFPYSAYMIGLAKDWIFTQPFETRPIVLTSEPWEQAVKAAPEEVESAIKFMMELLPKPEEKNEDSASAA